MSKEREGRDETPDDNRISPMTVARNWLPWCAVLIFVMTLGWTALIAWDEVVNGNHSNFLRTAIVVGTKVAPAAPATVLYAILIVGIADAIGGFAVVTKRYLERKWIKPLIERQKAEAERQKAEGRAEGRKEANRDWVAWNRRRVDAETKGEPFNEAPPAS